MCRKKTVAFFSVKLCVRCVSVLKKSVFSVLFSLTCIIHTKLFTFRHSEWLIKKNIKTKGK